MATTSSFGERLRRERQLRGVTLEEVSSATRISTRFLEAIEGGHWEQLPGGAFNRGFIRSTSRYLGLDEDGMVAEYALETKSTVPVYIAPRAKPKAELPRDWKRIAASIGAILVLIVGGWFAGSRIVKRVRSGATATRVSEATGKNHVEPVAAAQAGAAPLQLVVRSSKTVALRVIADGEAAFDGWLQMNDERHFGARQVLEISASDAGAVRLELNGQLREMTASAGQPGRITLTAEDAPSSVGGVH